MLQAGLIEPVHGIYCQVQTTVQAPWHQLKQNSTFKHEMVKNLVLRNNRRCVHTMVIMEPSM
jgi:hypothetical protein